MQQSELVFWQKQAHRGSGSLVIAVRTYQKRAIKFFGAIDVLKEDERALMRTLKAYAIAVTPTRSLLTSMNRIPKKNISKMKDKSPIKIKFFREHTLLTIKHIAALKKAARQHLCSVTGRVEVD
jgi:hypothetical protein